MTIMILINISTGMPEMAEIVIINMAFIIQRIINKISEGYNRKRMMVMIQMKIIIMSF